MSKVPITYRMSKDVDRRLRVGAKKSKMAIGDYIESLLPDPDVQPPEKSRFFDKWRR